ncbi:MAG: flagellar filament capping protein FliD [Defluviitaleaceae bacterium]|nr:flagellar filament capping protein FliD [Defluviitaleaceae bacterium]
MFTNQLRFNGMSGIDVNGMVQQIMRAESVRLDRLHQRRARLQWQQDTLQGVTRQLQQLQSRHLDLLNPTNNIRLTGTFNAFNITSQINGANTSAITVSGTPSANQGSIRMSVTQLARAEAFTFRANSNNLTGTIATQPSGSPHPDNFRDGDSFFIRLDNGVAREIRIDATLAGHLNSDLPADRDAAQTLLNQQLAAIYGERASDPNAPPGGHSRFANFVIGSGGSIELVVDAGHTATLTAGERGSGRQTDEHNSISLRTLPGGGNWTDPNSIRNTLRGQTFTVNGESISLSNTVIDGISNNNQLIAALNDALDEAGVSGLRFGISTTGTGVGAIHTLTMNFTGSEIVEIDDADAGGLLRALGLPATGSNAIPAGGSIRMSSALLDLGFTNGQTSAFDPTRRITDVFDFGSAAAINFAPVASTDPRLDPENPTLGWASFQINGSTVNIHEEMTVQQFQSAVAATGVATLEFDGIRNVFSLQASQSGIEGGFTLRDSAGAAVSFANIFGTTYEDHITAQDARVTIHDPRGPAHNVTLTRPTNSFQFEGLNITLNHTTNIYDSAGLPTTDPAQIITINFQRDISRPVDAVREFVDSYNALWNEMRSLFNTTRARVPGSRFEFYEPLTTEQRRAMSESEIRDWEDQARLGIVHRDPMLREIMDLMRREMFEPVRLENGSQIALFEIGITFTREGNMEINEDRLREALETRGEDVTELFTRRAESPRNANNTTFNARLRESGIGERLNDIIDLYTFGPNSRLVQRAGSPDHITQSEMLRRIQDMDDRISAMNETLIRRENMHFSRFAAMEQAIMRSNMQIEMLWSSMGW